MNLRGLQSHGELLVPSDGDHKSGLSQGGLEGAIHQQGVVAGDSQ